MAFPPSPAPPAAPPAATAPTGAAPAIINSTQPQTDADYLELYKRCKRECYVDRWRFERVWTRNIHYANLRQWLGQYDQANGWRDARVARGVPKPVTSKPKEAVQVIRSMFTATSLGVDVRPLRNDVKSVTTATTASKMAPLLATLNKMPDTLHEGDWWFIVTGNVVYHVAFEDNGKYVGVPIEHCATCGLDVSSDQIASNQQRCPKCKTPAAGNFTPALDQQGQPRQQYKPVGQTKTTALSLLEVAFPFMRTRWEDVDFLIRMRWRTKRYYETHPELKDYIPKIQFAKSSSERSLQIFQSLPFQTEISPYASAPAGSSEEEGVAEDELWIKPTPDRPEGLVLRVAGDGDTPVLLHLEESEGIPGPLPYHEASGDPLWTFHHAGYEHVGGRVIASSALDPVIHKFDQLNRLDSIVEMMMTRMAIPQILKPKGQIVEWMGDSPAMPGLVAEYAPAPGGGKPELWRGTEVPRSWAVLREQIVNEIDAGMGISDILKGKQPQGVEAFSAMQLLVEAGEARFAGAFQSRANCFRDISRSQMEIEREYGPKTRTASVLSESRSYAFDTYQTADLDGEVTFDVADGSTRPKTSLGERAAIEHLHQLGGVDLKNPETQYTLYQKFGQTELIPSIDKQHQRALQNQDAFQKWVRAQGPALMKYIPPPPPPPPAPGQMAAPPPAPPPDPSTDPTYPLTMKPWYDAPIHRIELLKWAVSDPMVELFTEIPQAEFFVGKYLHDLEQRIAQQNQQPPERIRTSMALTGADLIDPQVREAFDRSQELPPPNAPSAAGPGAPAPAQGAALAARNSNQNSAPVGNTPQPGSAALTTH